MFELLWLGFYFLLILLVPIGVERFIFGIIFAGTIAFVVAGLLKKEIEPFGSGKWTIKLVVITAIIWFIAEKIH